MFVKKERGFTLVEMMVTISIMLIITGGGIAAFIGFNDKQNVQVAVNDLKTLLRAAQTKAKTGEGAEGCRATSQSLRGYRVFITDGSSTATLYKTCADGKFTLPANRDYISRDEINFDSNVSAGKHGGGNIDIEFLSLLGGVDGAGLITISGLGSNVYTFEVTAGGEIKEGAFL
ncbi:prepilin-type N-terminal cleavage/methylation domain-containing protein [Patescibacteria group bacterium]|nr:prepilin-type N-terminal cleavage/methylation domain-containing protein [Patescibacteria group bacterium]